MSARDIAARIMTPKEIQILHQACIAAGVDASKIQPDNPFKKSGGTAAILQAAVSQIDPAQAARWRVGAGHGLSLATMAEMQSGQQLSDSAMQDLWEHDAAFVADTIKQRQQAEEQTLAMFEAESDRMRRAREGDAAVDFQNAKNAAEEEARAESMKRHQELQQRIQQKQVQSAQLAGRLIN